MATMLSTLEYKFFYIKHGRVSRTDYWTYMHLKAKISTAYVVGTGGGGGHHNPQRNLQQDHEASAPEIERHQPDLVPVQKKREHRTSSYGRRIRKPTIFKDFVTDY
ncbi:hypothetical protein LOTGIDRAFT_152208 [Lottia gigantea]|uniref:Uncharacterized protein n=1 Tax=Lottia gigantea TaxID=225164 RepID=V4BHN1_LOTGI|nr:hypothetical protein LOTGIDRAFT_152208 [Lottia gigantea]ESP05362.1 hypothetical protein LOTGIDRAFT_152208 [Lottia gigantea]